jgi:aminoglycoside N3'-acetyltransferase
VLTADLLDLGVRPGDTLMLHASLSAIGRPPPGGADEVIDALEAAVGPTGTLMMVLGGADDGVTPFDPATTPSDPDVGRLAEVFRRRPGTLVTPHPEGRFAARGARARELLGEQPWDDYFGPGSPLERLLNFDGSVLRLGADENTTTLIHYAEHLLPLAGKRRVRRERLVMTPGGPERRVVSTLDDNDGIVDWPGEDYFALILRAFLAAGRARRGRVGNAPSELMRAADLVPFAVAWMSAHFAPLLRPPDGGVTPGS